LAWTLAVPPGAEQLVALTTVRNGLDHGRYRLSKPLPPDRTEMVWEEDVEPGVVHYWRVLTRQADGWAPSETATFNGPTCVADYQPGEP